MMRLALVSHLCLIMSRSRLKILQGHLCCTTSVASHQQRLPNHVDIRRSLATKSGSATVTEVMSTVKIITDTSGIRPTETAAQTVMGSYDLFTAEDKADFLTRLAINFQCDQQSVVQNFTTLSQAVPKAHASYRHQHKLRESLTSPYELLFREMGSTQGGVKFLVDLRRDLIEISRNCSEASQLASLQAMNHNLKELLALWFGVGFLSLERITWKSPCDLLEKIAGYEGVHPVRNVSDLRLRVGAYRRCYTFIHPSMPDEPVVILHVALTDGISNSIQSIVPHPSLSNQSDFKLNKHSYEDPARFNTAIFYSITSTQTGLRGIDLGNYLIKSVVRQLLSEFPHLTQFSSLSPIPGFRDWLLTEIKQQLGGVKEETLLTVEHINRLSSALDCQDDKLTVLSELKKVLQDGVWCKDPALSAGLKDTMLYLCVRYLYLEKHRNFALNSVANFHLRNGATLWRINWLANTTAKGMTESCGLMVNYRYYLDRTAVNSEQYNNTYTIDTDRQVLELLH